MNKTTLFDELTLNISEMSPFIGGIWESENNLVLSENLLFQTIYNDIQSHSGPMVIDIGASTGCLSLFNKNRRFLIFSFEPNPTAFNELVSNVVSNDCNTFCYNVALGNHDGTAFMSQHQELWGYGYNRIIDQESDVKIPIHQLDHMIPFNTNITHVKIDVEGYEMFVLRGMKRILEQKPVLYLEMIESNFQNYSYTSTDIINFLEKFGYVGEKIDENNYKFV